MGWTQTAAISDITLWCSQSWGWRAKHVWATGTSFRARPQAAARTAPALQALIPAAGTRVWTSQGRPASRFELTLKAKIHSHPVRCNCSLVPPCLSVAVQHTEIITNAVEKLLLPHSCCLNKLFTALWFLQFLYLQLSFWYT